jgi:cytochrome c-type biogenesis protein CcmH/NrfG
MVPTPTMDRVVQAEDYLTRLIDVDRKDPQVWRLLGEVRSALQERAPAVAAYREAFRLAEADVEVLKGFAGALVANARPAEAVRVVEVRLWPRAEQCTYMKPIK